MDRLSILITGGNGYIAQSLYKALGDRYNITLITRKDFDLNDKEQTTNFLKDKFFDFVIHTAIVGGSRLKEEDESIITSNLKMYQNLLDNRNSYGKFISFGSGAELGNPTTPYGKSKMMIADSMSQQKDFLNVRIFAVFDEHELDTRFIKANVKRYINNEPMIVHEDKFMDFFYMEDLIKLIEYFLQAEEWDMKEVDCVYRYPDTLTDIAYDIINQLDNHRVAIEVGKWNEISYIGSYTPLPINYVGLKQGIKNVYNKLK